MKFQLGSFPLLGGLRRLLQRLFLLWKSVKRTCFRIGTKLPLAIWTLNLGFAVGYLWLFPIVVWVTVCSVIYLVVCCVGLLVGDLKILVEWLGSKFVFLCLGMWESIISESSVRSMSAYTGWLPMSTSITGNSDLKIFSRTRTVSALCFEPSSFPYDVTVGQHFHHFERTFPVEGLKLFFTTLWVVLGVKQENKFVHSEWLRFGFSVILGFVIVVRSYYVECVISVDFVHSVYDYVDVSNFDVDSSFRVRVF